MVLLYMVVGVACRNRTSSLLLLDGHRLVLLGGYFQDAKAPATSSSQVVSGLYSGGLPIVGIRPPSFLGDIGGWQRGQRCQQQSGEEEGA